MAHVSRKLTSSFEGALAGGGDPATSPLYVFGPFLRLIVVAGVARITFGASVWLVVLTIAVVSAMYRLVMQWITDGSGGSGLSEEEFGGWAVKLNAGITFVEYTLTFLVSVAALVTFISDRFPVLGEQILGIEIRTYVAIGLSVATGWLVNRGPKVTARAFGPATAGVLVLLWLMMIATVIQHGLRLPAFDLAAFSGDNLGYTIGGYTRILAVMTGIEIFANLVPAYTGKVAHKSRKAFGSLVIIMGTTSLTMLIVGPAILELSDPNNPEVSVFTQTMDQLLPEPLAIAGTLVGVLVLLSAAAASALGLQNLFVGLKLRHYVPPPLGRLNRFGVAGAPVWTEVAIVVACFLLFGTSEETYLAIYAAGVFILLSMTGWAASKRLLRELRADRSRIWVLGGTLLAATLTSVATAVILYERFGEGAWTYLVFLPLLYLAFGYFRRRLGPPTVTAERVGAGVSGAFVTTAAETVSHLEGARPIGTILVPLDGSDLSARVLPSVLVLARRFGSEVVVATVGEDQRAHIEEARDTFKAVGVTSTSVVLDGSVAESICDEAHRRDVDVIAMSTRGNSGVRRLVMGSTAAQVVRLAHRPLFLWPAAVTWDAPAALMSIAVGLDGSEAAERVIPWAEALAHTYGSHLHLISATEEVASPQTHSAMEAYLEAVATSLRNDAIPVDTHMVGADPARAILEVATGHEADLIAIATHGRGGLERVVMGSVADSLLTRADRLVLLIPIVERRAGLASVDS